MYYSVIYLDPQTGFLKEFFDGDCTVGETRTIVYEYDVKGECYIIVPPLKLIQAARTKVFY